VIKRFNKIVMCR